MEIEYLDRDARRIATPPGIHPPGWTDAEVVRLRLVAQCVRASMVVEDLLSLRSLRLCLSDPAGVSRYMTDLSANRSLVVTFKADSKPITAMLDIASTRTDPRR